MMIPRSLVKHQYKSVGTNGGSGGPAVFMLPFRGAPLVQLQPSSTAEQRLCFGGETHSERGGSCASVPAAKTHLLCRQLNGDSSKGLGKALWGI